VSGQDDRVARANWPAQEALRLHPLYRGKIQTAPKVPVRDARDFSIWYSPGVAAPCLAIAKNPELVYEYTNKGNLVAIVTDGTRVLGLGDIGPTAGLPVMEGKALLFKLLGGVDAIPICLATKDPAEIVRTVQLLEPSFGGINLEDIAQPKCFRVLESLRQTTGIPVWHDDQQGTATVLLAGLLSATAIVGKELRALRVAMIGAGAANIASYRLLRAAGVDPARVVMCDSKGILHRGRGDLERPEWREKWAVCTESNGDGLKGGIAEAMRGADVCIAFARPGPDVIRPEWVASMARDAIVFACANPVPEIWPWVARDAGARIVATGRSDFDNQVNNSLVFPGLFRGALDVRARTITDGMAIACARELAAMASERGASDTRLLPTMNDPDVAVRLAVAAGAAAVTEGVARLARSREEIMMGATRAIEASRAQAAALVAGGGIAPIT
jgi:malate dehydrogenase (oxaloacetate-decarboxylating)